MYDREFGDEELDFFDDFVDIEGPSKYVGVAEDWEGVQRKIGMLQGDITVSALPYMPEDPRYGYAWLK